MEPKYPGCNCNDCPLKDEEMIPPSGPLDAKICLVGQAPAYYEKIRGRNFSGPSGAVLDASLEEEGLHREDVRADNSVLCFVKAGEGDPPYSAVLACKGHFDDLEAEVIVPMGNSALASFLGPNHPNVMSVANALFTHEGRKILPLIHPAFYLRKGKANAAMFRDFQDGISLLRRSLEWKDLPSERSISVEIFEDKQKCISFLNELENNPPEVLAVDLETDQPDTVRGIITCVSLSYNDHESFIIPWNGEYLEDHNSSYIPLLENEDVYQALKSCLEAQPGILAHNAPFDAVLLRREGIDLLVKDDSLLMHYALDERKGSQGLKRVCKLLFGVLDWEEDLKPYLPNKEAPFTLIPPDTLFKYAGYDSCRTVELRRNLREVLDQDNNEGPRRLYEKLLTPCNNMLIDISQRGVAMDKDALVSALREMPQKLEELEKELEFQSDDRFFNPRSPKQVAAILYDKFKIADVSKVRSTRREILEDLQLMDPHPFIDSLLEYRQYHKVCNTYMINLAKMYADGRGHPDQRLFGTDTGRMSGFILVIPRESRGDLYKAIKNVFVSDNDCIMWASDYKGAELRVQAVLSEDPWLLEVLADPDTDFHSLMAEQLYGDKFLQADAGRRKELRVIAKMFVFGLNYGREAKSVARQLGCSIREAEELIAKYFKPMPKYLEWRKFKQRQAVDDEYLEGTSGRRRRFPLITEDGLIDIWKQAINTPIQTDSNDANLTTMEKVHSQMYPLVRPMWPIHDAIYSNVSLECTASDLQDFVTILETSPMEFLKTDLPFFMDHAIGTRWGDLKTIESDDRTEIIERALDYMKEVSLTR